MSQAANTTPWKVTMRRWIATVHRIIGAPDYETYLAHMQRKHPGCTPLDARAFEQQRLVDRYKQPGSRCC
jgi:uncharacterized short protein YbdD (DUF466 family)